MSSLEEEVKTLTNLLRNEIEENIRQRQVFHEEIQELEKEKEKFVAELEAKKAAFEAEKAAFEVEKADFEAEKADFEAEKAAFEAEKAEFEAEKAEFEAEFEAENTTNPDDNNVSVDLDDYSDEEDYEVTNPMDEAINIMTNGCSNISIPKRANAFDYRSRVALKAAALVNTPCFERRGLVHSSGCLTCKQEAEITGDKFEKGGKAHLQWAAIEREIAGENGKYIKNANKTQTAILRKDEKSKCLISLNKLKKNGTLGEKQGGIWKYILRDGEENEGFYDRINEMLCV